MVIKREIETGVLKNKVMRTQKTTEEIKGYCAQCSCYCRIISSVSDGVFIAVKPDEKHPLTSPICAKALAGPELVYNKQRLQYPMRRTRPKGDPDPGWERISWDEALETIATKLNQVKAEFGPEAVATSRAAPAGSAIGEIWPWIRRFSNAFGTPNNVSTTHICQWHRDNCSGYTFGKANIQGTSGRAEFEQAGSILIWGVDITETRLSLLPLIEEGMKKGAKLVVIDSRKTNIAAMADLWLQPKPATDGALALSMLNVMIKESLYDREFTRDWTTAPFLVRTDTGNFLKSSEVMSAANSSKPRISSPYVVMGSNKTPQAYTPGATLTIEPELDDGGKIRLTDGNEVKYKTAFRLLREAVADYEPSQAEALTGIPSEHIKNAVKILTNHKPACWYAWNGIEQNINASQTNRAVCLFYALTGDYDKPGGNTILPPLSLNPITGLEFWNPNNKKCLGYKERPLGPAGTSAETQGYEFYKAILTGKPYPIKAMLNFGGNLITSSAPVPTAREALTKLDFHAHMEMFLTPTAELADIVLPAASSWESWHVGINVAPGGEKAYIQLRPAVVPPRNEARTDFSVLFELAKRLGMGDKFWDGDVEAGIDYMLAPLDITVKQLRQNKEVTTVNQSMEYQKYSEKDDAGRFVGFKTSSKKVEIYSQVFRDHGYDPLPSWTDPFTDHLTDEYPLIFTGGKVSQFNHSQHRALPSLRRAVPHPFLEINPQKAKELDIKNDDWVTLETPYGGITLQAKLTKKVAYNVVSSQNGWWQGCPELNLPGYDPFSSAGANANLIHSTDKIDPISGSLPNKGYPCKVKKKEP